jgi:hypothetical protein
MFCRDLTCVTVVPDGQFYCDAHGGRGRAKDEGLLDPRPEKKKEEMAFGHADAQRRDDRAVGQGLGRFTTVSKKETPAEREKREAERAKRRAKRLAAQPKKGPGGNKMEVWGKGTSRKSTRRRKKDQRRGIVRVY